MALSWFFNWCLLLLFVYGYQVIRSEEEILDDNEE